MEIVVFLMAERIKAPHRKAGIFQRQRQRWQVRLGTKKGNSFLMEEKWGHPISLQSLLLAWLCKCEQSIIELINMNLIVYQTKIYKNQTFADLAPQKESTGVIRHVFRPLKLLPSYQLVVNAFLNTKKKNSNNVINFCVGIMKDQSYIKQVSTQQE